MALPKLGAGLSAGVLSVLVFASLLHGAFSQEVEYRCDVPGDVLLLLDGSLSIQPRDWQRVKNFVSILIDQLAIGPLSIHLGMITYGAVIGNVITLDYKERSTLKMLASALQQPATTTNTGMALERMRQMFREKGRPGIPHVGIVITDGNSDIPQFTKEQAALAKMEGITLIAIGVGDNIFRKELEGIASSPDKMLNVSDFMALPGLVSMLRNLICWVIVTTTSTSTTTTTPRTTPTPTTPPSIPSVSAEPLACDMPADVLFVLDGSDSITSQDWVQQKAFVFSLIGSLDIDPQAIHAGIIVFSSAIGDKVELLPFKDKARLQTQTLQLAQPAYGTNTALGIEEAWRMLREQGRAGTPQVVIVITDGLSKVPQNTTDMARKAQGDGIVMIAVGVGDAIYMEELRTIASSERKVFNVTDFRALRGLVQELKDLICKAITTPATIPTPRTTTTPPIVTPSPETLCSGCLVENGIGFNPHPTDCSKYVSCLRMNGRLTYEFRSCPFGFLYDREAMSCRPQKEVDCPLDPCRGQADGTTRRYEGQGCRAYWLCKGGQALPRCCTPGSYFHHLFGCVLSSSCQDPCPPKPAIPQYECKFKVHADKTKYVEVVQGGREVVRPCPSGATYDPKACLCLHSIRMTPRRPACTPVAHFSFDYGIHDQSGHGHTPVLVNVRQPRRGSAHFNGKSALSLPGLAAMQLNDKLVLKIRYMLGNGETSWPTWQGWNGAGWGGGWTGSRFWSNSSSSTGGGGLWGVGGAGSWGVGGTNWSRPGFAGMNWTQTGGWGTDGSGWTGSFGFQTGGGSGRFRFPAGDAGGGASSSAGSGILDRQTDASWLLQGSDGGTAGTQSSGGIGISSGGTFVGGGGSMSGGTVIGGGSASGGSVSASGGSVSGGFLSPGGTLVIPGGTGISGGSSITGGTGISGGSMTSGGTSSGGSVSSGGPSWTVTGGMTGSFVSSGGSGSSSSGSASTGVSGTASTGGGSSTGGMSMGAGVSSGGGVLVSGGSSGNQVSGGSSGGVRVSGGSVGIGGLPFGGTAGGTQESRSSVVDLDFGYNLIRERDGNWYMLGPDGNIDAQGSGGVDWQAVERVLNQFRDGSDGSLQTVERWYITDGAGAVVNSGPGDLPASLAVTLTALTPNHRVIRTGFTAAGSQRWVVRDTDGKLLETALGELPARYVASRAPGGAEVTWTAQGLGPAVPDWLRAAIARGSNSLQLISRRNAAGQVYSWSVVDSQGRTIKEGNGTVPEELVRLVGNINSVPVSPPQGAIVPPSPPMPAWMREAVARGVTSFRLVTETGPDGEVWRVLGQGGQVLQQGRGPVPLELRSLTEGQTPQTGVSGGTASWQLGGQATVERAVTRWQVRDSSGAVLAEGTGDIPPGLWQSLQAQQGGVSGWNASEWYLLGGDGRVARRGRGMVPRDVLQQLASSPSSQQSLVGSDGAVLHSKDAQALLTQQTGGTSGSQATLRWEIRGSDGRVMQTGTGTPPTIVRGATSGGGSGGSVTSGTRVVNSTFVGPLEFQLIGGVGDPGFLSGSSGGTGGVAVGGPGSDIRVPGGPSFSFVTGPPRLGGRRRRNVATQPMVLLSNGKGVRGEAPSILLTTDGRTLTFQLKTQTSASPASLQLPASPGPNEVTILYDGAKLFGLANGKRQVLPLSGKIEGRPGGVTLGASAGMPGLVGDIAEFFMYTCIP